MNFKPFWLEINQIFQEVITKIEFELVKEKFKKHYPLLNIMELKIAHYDFNPETKKPFVDKPNLISFGQRREHNHVNEYNLFDYFNEDTK